MKSVMAYLGITNVNLTLERGEFIGRKEPETFDRILLDAPCSSEGRFSTLEPKTMRYWKPGKIKEMVHKQKALMGSALMALKPGGVLVYSTCTFAPEENEGIVHWALSKYKEAIEVLPLSCPFPQVMPGLLEWGKKSYDAELTKTLRILPSAENEAFFIAKILKKDTN